MEHFSFIASLAALVLTVMNIWGKVSHPVADNHKAIADLEARLEKVEQKIDRDWQSFERQESVNEMLLKSQWAIMAHLLDGNHTSQLQACKNETEHFLLKKGGGL